jgi:hypothetical protein
MPRDSLTLTSMVDVAVNQFHKRVGINEELRLMDQVFRFQFFVRRPCPKRIFFASSVIPGGAGLIVFANAYAR